jgi:outer membrane protein assembly factor BamB
MERNLSRGIQRAEESIKRGEIVQALQFLDEVLGRDGDVFVETSDDGGYSGLKERARQMIRDLPPEGHEAYEAAHGPIAERRLRQAIAAGDAAAIEAVAQRYFYTAAGLEAALLAAGEEDDAGRHLAAALLYEQLLETPAAVRRYDPGLSVRAAASWLAAGETARAEKVLEGLTARGSHAVEIGGRQQPLDFTAEPLKWLREVVGEPSDAAAAPRRQWITFRGNGARNGETSGGLPHMRVRWRVRLMNHPRLETLFEDLAANNEQSGDAAPVASAPVAAGDFVLVRTPHGLLAVDFRTGKRVWRTEPQRDRELEQLVRGGAEEEATNPELVRSFSRRMWEDYLYGVPSSDGARVYVIRDLPLPASMDYDVGPLMGGMPVEAAEASNKLCAYDLATQGKLVWEIDGASAKGQLAGAYFLGAPLAVGPSLYALVEIRSGVYLAALERETGELEWLQQLANLEVPVLMDLDRRLQASMPSYDAGILVCPTGAGLVVGVDLGKRSLAWAYRYDAVPRLDAIYRSGVEQTEESAGHWTDGAATIVDGRVLLTPPESRHLHCLDVRTGKLLWKRPRGAMRRLACVHDGTVLLVGNTLLTGVSLADGKPAWKKSEFLSLDIGASPSGSGFLSEGLYYLPLTTAEVDAVDVANGEFVSRAAARDGVALGNLICHRGSVISQNGLFLDCFDQIEVLRKRSERRLARRPDDVQALRTLGEVAYNEGRLSDALDLLERAHQVHRDDLQTRDVLAECLTTALDDDFVAYRSKLPLLKELDDGVASQRLSVLRIESEGLLEAGEPLKSAEACFELYRLAEPSEDPMEIGRSRQTVASAWVAAQLTAAWEKSDAEDRNTIEAQALTLVESISGDSNTSALERYLDFFGTLPATEPLKLKFARQLAGQQRTLEAQQLLLDLRKSDDVTIRGEAVARLAAELHQADLHSLATELDRELAGPLADVKCLDGATGRELVKRWREEGVAAAPWPTGKVQARSVAAVSASARRVGSPLRPMRWERCDEILGRASALVAAPARGGELVLVDGEGKEFFRTPIEHDNPSQYRPQGHAYGVTRGNLMVASMGRQLVAFNTLTSRDGPTPTILWRAQVGNDLDYNQIFTDDPSGGASRRPGSFRAGRSTDNGRWIGVIGPLTSRSCVFQDQRRLACVDALTGETLWSRTDAPPNCDLYGDDKFVFAQPMDSTTAHVFGALDGRTLGKVKAPPFEEQLVTRGRIVVRWRRTEEIRQELSAIDVFSGEVLWRHDFSPGAKVDVDQGRYVAVVEAEGRAVIVDAEDGRAVVDQPLDRQTALHEVHVSAAADGFVLIVHRRNRTRTDRVVRPFTPLDSSVVSGQVYSFGREGGPMRWNRPADIFEQAMLPAQPPDLPFIAFAGMLQTRGTSVLVLDKATGRTLFSGDDLPAATPGMCMARVTNAARHEAAVELGGRTILLEFTNDRRPPEPPALADVESSAHKTSGGLMRILQNLGEGP